MKFPTSLSAALLPSIAATSLLISGCGIGEASVADDGNIPAALPVETTIPFRSDMYATYAATASIASDADAPVTARAGGSVIELIVEEGDRVVVGQILARLDGERMRLEMLAAKANLDRAIKEYARNEDLNARGLVSTAMFEGLRFDLESLQASYEIKRLNYDYSNIRATISGVVSSRDVKPGENLSVGQVAFRITETDELIAYLQIPQAELAKFQAGHNATLEVASMPGHEFKAKIVRISPTIDAQSGTFRATAIIDNTDGDLAPGMFGRFTIAYEKHPDALVIPAKAILDEDEETTVYIVRDGQVLRRPVKVGIEENGRVEILNGLEEYDQVVVVGHSGLRDGSRVLASVTNLDRHTG